jgi:hypothetical protein
MTRIHISNIRREVAPSKLVLCTCTFTPAQGPIMTRDTTIDYAISLTQGQDRGTIDNAGEVLLWLHRNVDFVPH